MVLEGKGHVLGFFLDPLTRGLRNTNPNVITWLSLPVAAFAAALLYASDPSTAARTGYLLFAAVAVSVIGILDLLDGRIARLSNRASASGDFLDHVTDRFVDILLIVAISFSAWADLRVGIFALAGVLLTSYMGTQAQAVGAGRLYGGFLTRADRIVVLIAAPLIDTVFVLNDFRLGWGPGADYALGVSLYYFAIAGAVTSLQRFVRTLTDLRRRA